MYKCPICSSDNLDHFARLRNSPLLQNVLFDTQDAALRARRINVDFKYCASCHFVFNPEFDDSAVEYSERYDNNQAESQTYRRYIDGLTNDIIQYCALGPGSTILEIGCGTGYFLSQMQRKLSCADIVGYDPAYTGQNGMDDHIHKSYFEATSGLTFDMVVLRHCFESLLHYSEVLEALIASIHDNSNVYIEIVNLDQIISARDLSLLFHEYHRYYSANAMATLLRRFDLVIHSCVPLFDNQYLGIFAAKRHTPRGMEKAFGSLLESIKPYGNIAIWGISGRAIALLTHLNLTKEVVTVGVDIDNAKQGKYIPVTGQRIIAPQDINDWRPDLIIVANSNYLREIREQCRFPTTFMTIDGRVLT